MAHENGTALRIGLCLAAHDQSASWFSYDLAGLVGHTLQQRPAWDLRRFQATGTWLPQVRHRTVVAALKAECDFLLFLDNDMRFPTDALLQLVARDRDVVAANYTIRHVPFPPCAVKVPGERAYTESHSTGLEEVASIGLGCLLVRAAVLRRIPPPWFMLGWHTDTQDYTGEDAYFCQRLREAGCQLWLDHDLSQDVSHLGLIEFEQSHAVKMKHALPALEDA